MTYSKTPRYLPSPCPELSSAFEIFSTLTASTIPAFRLPFNFQRSSLIFLRLSHHVSHRHPQHVLHKLSFPCSKPIIGYSMFTSFNSAVTFRNVESYLIPPLSSTSSRTVYQYQFFPIILLQRIFL